MSRLPDFIIIGAMKCATSTLHEQLAGQPGVVMTEPKEPCFFSDDAQWRRGVEWYRRLFREAQPGDLCGESSTHYTKLPTYPQTVERMRETFGTDVRLIYMMRDPIDRLVSQFIHEWSQGQIADGESIDDAIGSRHELVEYGRYAYQLAPYLDCFGEQAILPVFFERIVAQPQEELERIGAFLNLPAPPKWIDDLARRNLSDERVRRNMLRDSILSMPGVRPLVRTIVPQNTRHRLMRKWSMQQRPELRPATRDLLREIYDQDLAALGRWMGLTITCDTFKAVAAQTQASWAAQPTEAAT